MLTKFRRYHYQNGEFHIEYGIGSTQKTFIFAKGSGCNEVYMTDEMVQLIILYRQQIMPEQYAPTFMEELGNAIKAFIQFQPQ